MKYLFLPLYHAHISIRITALVLIIGVVGLLAACDVLPRPVASRDAVRRDLLHTQTFETVSGWDTYDAEGVRVQGESDVLRATVDGGQYIYSLSDQRGENVSIDIEAQFLGGDEQGGYGLVCRANPAVVGSGYYFLISSDGAYTIRRGQGREVEPLVSWGRTPSIQTGAQVNTIRAVCVEDYLALYINGEFVAETRDDLYSGEGYVGVAVVARRDQTLDVNFDNLYIWSAE